MHAEIEVVKARVLKLYETQRNYLRHKPREFIEDLMQQCRTEMHSPVYSTRTAAEINFAATHMILNPPPAPATTPKPNKPK